QEIGVCLHEEADGKLFPDTNRARDVLDALLREAAAVGVTLLAAHPVIEVTRSTSGFRVRTSRGELDAAAVVLATGGQSLPKTGSDGAGFASARRLGHIIAPTPPALASLGRMVPASVAAALLEQLAIDDDQALAHLSRDDRRKLTRALVEWPLPVVGTRGYRYAEATAGGVALTEIDPATMASRVCPGLFLVGEMLDVDGRIGGFNFQWAWSSGFVAGRALARHDAQAFGE